MFNKALFNRLIHEDLICDERFAEWRIDQDIIQSMKKGILRLYQLIFCRPGLYQLHLTIYKLALRGMGVLNSDTAGSTGEGALLTKLARNSQLKMIVDVGANDSVYGVDKLPSAKFVAFEPHPESFKRLTRGKLPNVTYVEAAASDKKDTTLLYDFADDADRKSEQPTSQLASLNKSVITGLHKQKPKSYKVKTVTLDNYAESHGIKKIDLLKIDAEGHELKVLLGAKKLIESGAIAMIQFEFGEQQIYSRVLFEDFIKLLKNYKLYRLLPGDVLPLGDYRPLTHELFGFQNILAVHEKEKDLIKIFEN